MDSIIFALSSVPLAISSVYRHHHLSCILPHNTKCLSRRRLLFSDRVSGSRHRAALPSATAGLTNSSLPRDGIYTVGDFMTRKEDLHVVNTTTTVEEALETLVEKRITGFPVVDDDWKLVLVKLTQACFLMLIVLGKYTFNEIQTLISKTNGKVVGDLMTPVPVAVREATNLEDAARLLLETRYRRLPIVDGDGKLVGIITRGNVVRAALQIKLARFKD